jgi:hypothetical protein
MTDIVTQIETAVSNEVKGVVNEVTHLLGDFEAFLAHNGSVATQQAVSAASTAVASTITQIEAAIVPIADDILNYALAKVPGGNALSASGVALLNAVIAKITATITKS